MVKPPATINFPNLIIRASAGTGKTFSLSNRYLQLLFAGVECQTILATTFTKKGAGEILDRIIDRLSDAALDEKSAKQLASELGTEVNQTRAAQTLYNLVRNLHRLEISTLDSFFNRVAKVFALELGLPPTWHIVDEQQISQMEDEAIQKVLRHETVLNLLHMLSKGEASRGVASMVRNTVRGVYAVYRESGPEPWDRLEKQGAKISTEVLDRLIIQMENLPIKGKRLSEHWARVVDAVRNEDWPKLLEQKSFQRSLGQDYMFGRTKLTSGMVAAYQTLMPHCAAFFSHRLIQQNHSTRDLLQSFGELMEVRKSKTGALRFDDVTERLQEFVATWHTARFAFRLDNQIQHLLLDEFQDTSLAQWNVIKPFAKSVTSTRSSLKSFFCVGDMKQAIFGWRGGVAEIFDLVDDQLRNLSPTKSLTASYRSSQKVIDLVNKVFLHLNQYKCTDPILNEAIHSWGKNWFEEHTTNRDLDGYFAIEMAADCPQEDKRFEPRKDNSRNFRVMQQTVKRIRELCRTVPERHGIGVIVRTNKEVRDLIGRLQAVGVQASEEGGTAITDSAAVNTILAAIRLADHPGDSIARFHVSHSPLASTLGLQPETDRNQRENSAIAFEAATNLRARLIADGYGPTVEALAQHLIDFCTERELLRLQHLIRIAFESPLHNDQLHLRPIRFVEHVCKAVKVSDQSSARVRVMTIHKAKGLEFDVVVLPMPLTSQGWAGHTPTVVVGRESPTALIDVASRYAGAQVRKLLPPNFQAIHDDNRQANVREAMCVMYVALTRAAHAVHIIMSHGAKTDHQSPAGVLLATVCPDKERQEGLIYDHGSREWFRNTTTSPKNISVDLSDFYLSDDVSWKTDRIATDIRSGRGLPTSTPSRLAGGDELLLSDIFQRHDNYEALHRGRLIHGCFERVKWLDESVPGMRELESHLRVLDPTAGDFDRIIAKFYNMLEDQNLKQLLSREPYCESYLLEFAPTEEPNAANRLEIYNERAFAVMLDDTLFQGIMDRLVLVHQGGEVIAADVIDFKSDIIEENQLQQKIEYYQPQLQAYRQAAARLTGLELDQVSLRLVFVEIGKVINLGLCESKIDNSSQKTRRKLNKSRAEKDGISQKPQAKDRAQISKPHVKNTSKVDVDTEEINPLRQRTFWD